MTQPLREKKQVNRRNFLQASGAAVTAVTTPYIWTTNVALGESYESANDRVTLGAIGTGSRFRGGLQPQLHQFGDLVAISDVDANCANESRTKWGEKAGHYPDIYEDYRYLLDRDDIQAVIVATTDHWHTKIAIEALRSGKDVYCEKPVTLTIDEGKRLCKVVEETGRVMQVGTQQRTEMGQRFLKALAIVNEGRIGEVTRCRVAIDGSPQSPQIPVADVPRGLNWERWLGQAPLVDYRSLDRNSHYPHSRCHYEFRWWYEYSGGKLTDWGAHHVDIAQWAMGMLDSGPEQVNLISVEHPVPLKDGHPIRDDQYNTATKFDVQCIFPGGLEMNIRNRVDDEDAQFGNGILIEGTKGRLFVSRGSLTGKPVEDLKENPLPEDAIAKVYHGQKPTSHFANFFDAMKGNGKVISDMFTHHRALTTCHLANIAMRLGRDLEWDARTEQIVGDEQANRWLTRPQRKGYEIPS